MNLFTSCVLYPGDISGNIIPQLMQHIFETKTSIKKPHPFTLYLTNEGHLLIGFTKDKMTKPLIPLDTLIGSYEINKRMGLING